MCEANVTQCVGLAASSRGAVGENKAALQGYTVDPALGVQSQGYRGLQL